MRLAMIALLFAASSVIAAQAPPIPTLPALSSSPSVPAAPSIDESHVLMPLPKVDASRVDLRFVAVARVIDLLYADVLRIPYVLDPAVLSDKRLVSFRFDKSQGDVRAFLGQFLGSLGYGVRQRDGVDYVYRLDTKNQDEDAFVYEPKYRNADYISRLLAPMFRGNFTANRSISALPGAEISADVPVRSAAALLDQATDLLVFVGSAREVAMLKKLLPQIDTAVGQVAVRAWVYEVTEQTDNNSAFQLALSLLGGRIGASIGAGSVGDSPNVIRLRAGGFEAAIAALNSDSRFKVVTSPNLRVRSGQTARLNVGQSVPVVGSVSYPSATASPVQSVQYQDAGVIFQVQPTVKARAIDLTVTEEISDFVRTTTGVNNSPTKNTRKLESSFSVEDGDAVLIGGLTQDKATRIDSGLSFLPSWMKGHSSDGSRTEILLLLQVQKL